MRRRFRWLMVAMLAMPAIARADASANGIVTLPITIDYATLAAAMKQQLFTDDGRAILWKGPGECDFLTAGHPALSRRERSVLLETDGHLSLGVKVGAKCINPIVWRGIIQAQADPYVAGHLLKLRIVDLNLLNAHREKTLIAGKGFDLVKRYFIPRLETFEFDLNPVTGQLKQLAMAASPPDVAARVDAALATLRVRPEIAVLDDGIRARLELKLPPMPTAAPAAPQPVQLTSAELAAFETQLDQWDAFLVFAVKQLAGVTGDVQFRDALLGLLLDSRARLVEALQNPQSGGPDPVRLLFLEVWQRLGEIVRAAAKRGTLGDRSLQFLEFVSAGDALFALDQAAPALGMRVSADDLRRLAHIMAPQATGDPLAFSFAEDPELQKLFGVRQPPEAEGPIETDIEAPTPSATPSMTPGASPSASATPSAAPTASPLAASPTLAPPSPTSVESPAATASPAAAGPTPTPAVTSRLDFLRAMLSPASAWGAEPIDTAHLGPQLQALGRKLRHAVATSDNAPRYRADMEQLIELSGLNQYASESLDPVDRSGFLTLVKAVAWQESCWRQFVVKNRRIVYLESSSHDIGLMQVNRYVWRGFYSIPRLEWDILYNSGAGMQILARLVRMVESKRAAQPGLHAEELARSVYAAYNGGPGAWRRWLGHEPPAIRAIDRSFLLKYEAVMNGRQIDILSCAAQWGSTPGH